MVLAGLRVAAVSTISLATVTIAAYVNLGGLGWPIIQGIPLRKFDQVLGGAILVAVLALVVDLIFALLQHAAVPAGLRAPTAKRRSRAAAGTPAPATA